MHETLSSTSESKMGLQEEDRDCNQYCDRNRYFDRSRDRNHKRYLYCDLDRGLGRDLHCHHCDHRDFNHDRSYLCYCRDLFVILIVLLPSIIARSIETDIATFAVNFCRLYVIH